MPLIVSAWRFFSLIREKIHMITRYTAQQARIMNSSETIRSQSKPPSVVCTGIYLLK